MNTGFGGGDSYLKNNLGNQRTYDKRSDLNVYTTQAGQSLTHDEKTIDSDLGLRNASRTNDISELSNQRKRHKTP